MGTTKTQVESDTTQASSTPAVEQARLEPEQHIGPVHAQRTSAPSPPQPPAGASSAEGSDRIMPFPSDASQVHRSQMTHNIQRSTGNARMVRMLEGVQAKLTVGEPGDHYEQEADAAASRIVSGQTVSPISHLSGSSSTGRTQAQARSDVGIQRCSQPSSPSIQRLCDQCAEEEHAKAGGPGQIQRQHNPGEEEEPLQEDTAAADSPSIDTDAAARSIDRSGQGSTLAPAMRSEMEQGFGADLSHVRIHTDRPSHDAARSINARAFTKGSDIYMGRGESATDRRLMAHELTHTIQQRGGLVSPTIQRAPPSGDAGDSVQSDGGASGQGVGNPSNQNTGQAGSEGADGRQEEVFIPSFDTGGAGGCPQIVEQEPMFPRGGGGGSQANDDVYGQLMGLMPGMGMAPGSGLTRLLDPFGLSRRLISYSASILWQRLPLAMRARVINRAIDLAIAGVAFLPKMLYATIFGPMAGWFRAGLIGFLKKIKGYGDRLKVALFEKYLSIALGQNIAFLWGYLKGIFEGFFVDGLIGIIQMIIDIICLIGKIPSLITTLGKFFGSFPVHMQAIAIAIMRFSHAMDLAAANALSEVQALFRNPLKIVGLLNTLGAASEAVSRRMGEMVADGLVQFMSLPAERIGKSVGRLSGMLLFEVVLIVATWGGGAIATVGKVLAKVALKVITLVGSRLLAVGRFIMSMLRLMMPFVKQAAGKLGRFFQGAADRLHDLMRSVADFFAAILRRCRRVGSWRCEIGERIGRVVKIGARFKEMVMVSARRSAGQGSAALRKLQRRLGDPESVGLFNGTPLTEEAAQGMVRQILNNATTQRFGRLKSSGFAGERGIAIFDGAGRGVLVRQSDGFFLTFLEEPRGLRNIFR